MQTCVSLSHTQALTVFMSCMSIVATMGFYSNKTGLELSTTVGGKGKWGE